MAELHKDGDRMVGDDIAAKSAAAQLCAPGMESMSGQRPSLEPQCAS
jgi:hypothetical protein